MEALNSFTETTIRHLWAVSWQVSILIVIIGIISLFSLRLSSNFRYWLWCIVLFRLCIPVNLTFPVNIQSITGDTLGIGISEMSEIIVPTRPLNTAVEFSTVIIPDSADPINFISIAGFIWLAAIIIISALIIARATQITFLLRKTLPITRPELCSLVKRLTQETSIKRDVRLCYMDINNVDSPAVIGILRPYILLPRSIADNWLVDDIEPLLLHELSHIKRNDLLVNWVQVVVQVVYFFHPLVWFTNSMIRHLREEVCDDNAVRLGEGRKRYSLSILKVMEETVKEPSLGFIGIGFTERKKSLERRIKRIMNTKYSSGKPLTVYAILTLILISIVSITVTCAKPTKQQLSKEQVDEDIIISINKEGEYSINGKKIPADSLKTRINEALTIYDSTFDINAIVMPDINTSPDETVALMNLIDNIDGINQIAYALNSQKTGTDVIKIEIEKVSNEIIMWQKEDREALRRIESFEKITIYINDKGEYFINGKKTSFKSLEAEINKAMENYDSSKYVVIETEGKTLNSEIITLSKLLESSGIKNISIIRAPKTTKQTTIIKNLGGMRRIMEGTEQVILNGKPLNRGSDYLVDYAGGEITLLKEEAMSPTADIVIRYEDKSAMKDSSKKKIIQKFLEIFKKPSFRTIKLPAAELAVKSPSIKEVVVVNPFEKREIVVKNPPTMELVFSREEFILSGKDWKFRKSGTDEDSGTKKPLSIKLSNPIVTSIEGEQVKLNGKLLTRRKDYSIDYETGEITLLSKDNVYPGSKLFIVYPSILK